MIQSLQNILSLAEQSEALSPEQKKAIADWIKEAGKHIDIITFKLERTEKVKRTTSNYFLYQVKTLSNHWKR